MKKFFTLLLMTTALLGVTAPSLWAQCTPLSAQLCISSDDYSTAYVGGTYIGNFPYAGAPGTTGAANPPCYSVPTALLTGAQVCLAIYTQNTAPQNVYTAWDLDVTCAGGLHSVLTSSGPGITGNYVPVGNPAVPPPNDGSSNPWYSPNYSTIFNSYCNSGVTASLWANALYNPLTGAQIPFISNNCSGDYGTSNGALFWRQVTTLPAPVAPVGTPNITLFQIQNTPVTNVGANTVTVSQMIVLCNSGGAVTNGSVTVTDNFITNISTQNTFQFGCWGFGDYLVPYTLCYYAGNNLPNEPYANSNSLIFPSLGNGCVTITAQAINYYDPVATCGLTLVNQASVSGPFTTKFSNPVTYIQAGANPTATPTGGINCAASTVVNFCGNLSSTQRADQAGGILNLGTQSDPLLPFMLSAVLNGAQANLLYYNGGNAIFQTDYFGQTLDEGTQALPNHGQVLMMGGASLAYAQSAGVTTYAWNRGSSYPPACTSTKSVQDSMGNWRVITFYFYQVNDMGTAVPQVNPNPPQQTAYAWYAFETSGGSPSNSNLIGGTGIFEESNDGNCSYDRGVAGDMFWGDFVYFSPDGSLASEGSNWVQGGIAAQTKPYLYLPTVLGGTMTVMLNFGTAGMLGFGQRDGLVGDATATTCGVICGVGTITNTPTKTTSPTATPTGGINCAASTIVNFCGNLSSVQMADQAGGILNLGTDIAPVLPFVIAPYLNGSEANVNPFNGGNAIFQIDNFDQTFDGSPHALPNHAQPLLMGGTSLAGAQGDGVASYAWNQGSSYPPACSSSKIVQDSMGAWRTITFYFYQVNDLGTAVPPVNPNPPHQTAYAWYAFETTGGQQPSNSNLIGGTGIFEESLDANCSYDRGGAGDMFWGDFVYFSPDGSLASEGTLWDQGGMGAQTKPRLYLPTVGGGTMTVILNFGTAGLLGFGQRDGLVGDATAATCGVACGSGTITNTPTRTYTQTSTPVVSTTLTPTPTRTPSPTSTGSFTSTRTNTPLITGTTTPSGSVTFTLTPTRTQTPTSTFTLGSSPTSSITNTFTPTRTNTPLLTNTFTPTRTFTGTIPFTFTNTITPTKTNTPIVTSTPVVIVSVGSAEPANSSQLVGALNVPEFQFQLTNQSSGWVTINGLTLVATGTGNDLTGMTSVNLYLDSNNNGLLEGIDIPLSSGTFAADNATMTLSFNNLLAPFGTNNYLVVYNFSNTASYGTYQSSIALNSNLTGVSAGGAATFQGAPINGAVISIVAALSPTLTFTTTSTPLFTYTYTATRTPTPAISTTSTWTKTPTSTNTITPTLPVTFTATYTTTPGTPGCCQVSNSVTFGTGGNFTAIAHLAVSGNTLYVADFDNFQVQKFQLPGMTPSGVIPILGNPYGMTTDSSGNLYVGCYGLGVVQKFDTSGNQTDILYTLSSAMGIAVDTNGDLYVSEEPTGTVEIFPWTGSAYGSPETLTSPAFSGTERGIVKRGNRLYVADLDNSQVYEFDDAGSRNFSAAQTVLDSGDIYLPTQLSMDAAGNLYVACDGSSSVMEFNAQSTAFAPFTLHHACDLAGYNPQGAILDASGNLYAGASAAPFMVSKINPCSGLVTPTGTLTPVATATFTQTPTPDAGLTIIYNNSEAACSAAFGCTITFVDLCRQLNLDFTTSYILMRLGATCGCQPSDIMQMRLAQKGWDEICAYYGLDWSTFAADLQTRINTLLPEVDNPNQLLRGASYDPNHFPIATPVSMPNALPQSGPYKENCTLCQ